jgi:hypothetical protein
VQEHATPISTEEAMDKRRKLPCYRALKAGSTTFNQNSGVDCRVRNLSLIGACLEVAN